MEDLEWEPAHQEFVNAQIVVMNLQKLELYLVRIQNALNVKLHYVEQNKLQKIIKNQNSQNQ